MIPILINLCLAGLKFFAGSICGLTSVTADAANNLMDSVTSAFTEIAALISAVPGGRRHKNGHGRFEWLVAIVMSCSIVMVGWELLRASIDCIRNPSEVHFHPAALAILVVSIAVKVFLYFYNSRKARAHNSQAYKAAALDCISDAVSTTAVLVSFIIQAATGIHLDGYCGALVSLFIMYNGIRSFADTSGRIIGDSIDTDTVSRLKAFILSYNGSVFSRCTNLQITDYGYERFGASADVVPRADRTAEEVLSDITGLRSAIYREFGFLATIQPMMPAEASAENALLAELKDFAASLPYAVKIDEETSLARQGQKIQVILNAEVPVEESRHEKEIISAIEKFADNREIDLIIKLSVRNDHIRERQRRKRKQAA